MITVELYFNGELADFDNEDAIVASYAANRLGELESREGNYTNTYTLPHSNPNKRIFENADQVNSNDDGPYRLATHWVIVEGIEIFRGYAKLEGSEQGYEVSAFSGNSDFYAELVDKKLDDLDLSDLDHERNDANVIASWGNTEGFIYAFADYGKYKELEPNADFLGEIIPEDLYPNMYLHTIIKRIADEANYTLEGEVLKNPRFLKQLLPFANFPLTPDNTNYFNGRKGESTKNGFSGGQQATTVAQPVILEELDDTGNNYNEFGYYVSPIKQRVRISFNFGLAAVGLPLTGKADVRVKLLSNGQNITLYRKTYKASNNLSTASGTLQRNLQIGDQVWVEIVKNSNLFVASLFVLSFEIDPIGSLSYDTNIEMSKTLPNVNQGDFFLDFMNQYGLISTCDTENRILHLIPFDEIEKNEPVDWSDKIDDSEKPKIRYRFDNYAQSNVLTFKVDEIPDNGDTRGLITDGKAKIFPIDDNTLELEYEAFESEFYLPDNEPSFQGQVTTIAPKIFNLKQEARSTDRIRWRGFWNNVDAYTLNDAVYRSGNYYMVKVSNSNTDPAIDAGVKWDAVDESDIWDVSDKPFYALLKDSDEGLIVKFASGDQMITKIMVNDTLDWNFVWDNHYQSFAKVITRTKIVRQLFRLNYADINQLNFRRPVYIKRYGALFYIDIVEQFAFNKFDSNYVTLVRL